MSFTSRAVEQITLLLIPVCFFVPPLAVSGRLVFLFDLLSSALVLLLIVHRPAVLSEKKWIWGLFALTLIVWIHGLWRPVDRADFELYQLVTIKGSLRFLPIRELVIALRFFIWILAAALAFDYFSRLPIKELRFFQAKTIWVARFSLLFAVLIAFSGKLFPEVGVQLANIYDYALDANRWWKKRAFGVFPSPVEGAAAYAFLLFIFAFFSRQIRSLKLTFVVICLGGMLIARSLTPIIGLCAVVLVKGLKTFFKDKARGRFWIALAFILIVAALIVFGWFNGYADKHLNMLHRLRMWSVYSTLLSLRWDLALLGLGFWPVHSDNTIVFMIARYGFFGAVFFVFSFWKPLFQFFQASPFTRYFFVFGVVSALTTDFWIYRPVIAIFLGCYIPLAVHERADS